MTTTGFVQTPVGDVSIAGTRESGRYEGRRAAEVDAQYHDLRERADVRRVARGLVHRARDLDHPALSAAWVDGYVGAYLDRAGELLREMRRAALGADRIEERACARCGAVEIWTIDAEGVRRSAGHACSARVTA